MTREQAIEYTKQAEVWAACFQRGECARWQADWAWQRASQAWAELSAAK